MNGNVYSSANDQFTSFMEIHQKKPQSSSTLMVNITSLYNGANNLFCRIFFLRLMQVLY